jgi:hypothetical protein
VARAARGDELCECNATASLLDAVVAALWLVLQMEAFYFAAAGVFFEESSPARQERSHNKQGS